MISLCGWGWNACLHNAKKKISSITCLYGWGWNACRHNAKKKAYKPHRSSPTFFPSILNSSPLFTLTLTLTLQLPTIPCHKKVPTLFLRFAAPTNSSYTSPLPRILPSPSTLNNSSQQEPGQRITNHWPSAPAPHNINNIITISAFPLPSSRKVHHDGQTHPWYWVWKRCLYFFFPPLFSPYTSTLREFQSFFSFSLQY